LANWGWRERTHFPLCLRDSFKSHPFRFAYEFNFMEKYSLIPFPKREWKTLRKALSEKKICSTVRCCNELGKYKTGQILKTPWGDLIKITKVKRYYDLQKIPTWKFFDKGMKISAGKAKIYGREKWDFISFKLTASEIKVNSRNQ
jgi:hypothetical protein